MKKERVFENNSRIMQVFYDRHGNPHEVKPGFTFVEDLSEVVDVKELVKKELERISLGKDVDEIRRVKQTVALVRATKDVNELEKLRTDETNSEVLGLILLKEKDLLEKQKEGEPGSGKKEEEPYGIES